MSLCTLLVGLALAAAPVDGATTPAVPAPSAAETDSAPPARAARMPEIEAAEALLRAGDFDAAKRKLAEAQKKNPRLAAAGVIVARWLLANNQLAQRGRNWNKSLRSSPTNRNLMPSWANSPRAIAGPRKPIFCSARRCARHSLKGSPRAQEGSRRPGSWRIGAGRHRAKTMGGRATSSWHGSNSTIRIRCASTAGQCVVSSRQPQGRVCRISDGRQVGRRLHSRNCGREVV